MGRMIKRVKFRYDKPATEKQLRYVQDLLTKIKEEAQDCAPRVKRFWEKVELPADLTRWEASGLISWLRNGGARFVALAALEIIKERLEGVKVTDADKRFSLLALGPAIEELAQELSQHTRR